jgi:uncharacterized protein DUF955
MRSDFESVDQLALWLLSRAGVSPRPPVDVVALAYALGVSRLEEESLDGEDGRLEVRGDEIVIVVSTDASRVRRRFTLAHEVAHLVLFQPDIATGALRRRLRLEDEERFCDALAGSLLLPSPWVETTYAERAQTLFNLRECARAADVSLSAAALRLSRIAGWRRILLRWRRHDDAWRLVSGCGYGGHRLDGLGSVTETGAVIDRVRATASGYKRTWLPLGVDGHRCVLEAEIHARGATTLALVDPDRSRPIVPSHSATRRRRASRTAEEVPT